MLKKKCIFLLICIIILVTGCKKNVNNIQNDSDYYPIEDDNNKTNISDGCKYEFKTGDSDLAYIRLNADEVIIPNGLEAYEAYYESQVINSDYKQRIVESLFDKDKNIYRYNQNEIYLEDIHMYKSYYQDCISIANTLGDNETCDIFTNLYNQKQKEEIHSVKYELATDYTGNSFIGEINGIKYIITFPDDGENAGFTLNCYPSILLSDYFPYEDNKYAFIWTQYGDAVEQDLIGIGAHNESEITKEEAVDYGISVLKNMEIDYMSCVEAASIEWDYSILPYSNYETTKIYDGYCITYSIAACNGEPVYLAYSDMLEYKEDSDADYMNGSCTIWIHDGGIIRMECRDNYQPLEQNEKHIEIMDIDTMFDTADEGIAKFFEINPIIQNSVEFNCIKLTYYIVKTSNGQYVLTPVWIMIKVSDVMKSYGVYFLPSELVMINAVTGEVINYR